MTYCTMENLVERFGIDELEAKAWDDDADKIDEPKVAKACQDATDQINMYVASSIPLPVASVPPALTRIACDIARYHLQSKAPLDEVKQRYAEAMQALKDIASGIATLGSAESVTEPANVEALRDDSDRVFTRESLAQY